MMQETLLELWAHEGEFTDRSDREIMNLSQEQILDKVNSWQYSELYLMGKGDPFSLHHNTTLRGLELFIPYPASQNFRIRVRFRIRSYFFEHT
jgi:hypothetical protein